MINPIKKFFLSRSTILAAICLALGGVVVASLFPQRFMTPPHVMAEWRQAHAGFVPLADILGLDHVYTTPWFAAILFLASGSLLLSTVEQGKRAFGKTFGEAPVEPEGIPLSVPAEALARTMRRHGYRPAGKERGNRFVRHPWGYWGSSLLHCGIMVTIAASLVIALTQQRGSLLLTEGGIHFPGDPWLAEENGLLAGKFVLPVSLRLDEVTPRFRDDHKVERLSSRITLLPAGAPPRSFSIAVNSMVDYQGIHVYQSADFGHAFSVEFTDGEGAASSFTLPIHHPESLENAGYNDFRLPWEPARLQAKYFVDAGMRSIEGGDPFLIMRLMDGEREVGRVSLKSGESGMLGRHRVHLEGVTKYTELIFVRITGMPGIFLGFSIIVLGGLLTYFAVPREFIVTEGEGGTRLFWRAAGFSGFYADEHERIVSELSKEVSDG